MEAKDRQIQRLRAEIETQKKSVYAKDQHLQSLETEVAALRRQLDILGQQSKQNVDKVRELLALKERELSEAKAELTAQTEALCVTIEALRANEQLLEQSKAEVERLENLLENLNKELRCKEAQLEAANSSTVHRPGDGQDTAAQVKTLWDEIQQLKQQNKQLTSHLEQAEMEVRKALDVVANTTSRAKTGAKRKIIKEEDDKDKDAVRLLESAMKRTRQENISQAP